MAVTQRGAVYVPYPQSVILVVTTTWAWRQGSAAVFVIVFRFGETSASQVLNHVNHVMHVLVLKTVFIIITIMAMMVTSTSMTTSTVTFTTVRTFVTARERRERWRSKHSLLYFILSPTVVMVAVRVAVTLMRVVLALQRM